MTQMFRRSISIAIVYCLLVQVGSAGDSVPRSSLQIDEILRNVMANERLYENIDVTLSREYVNSTVKTVKQKPAQKQAVEGQVSSGSFSVSVHYVGQDGMFRVDREGESRTTAGSITMDRLHAFDGDLSRLFEQNAFGNLTKGGAIEDEIVRPHMFLLKFMPYYVPLSTYMSGHEAMAAHRSGNWQPGYSLSVVAEGQEEVDGLQCCIVSVTTTVPSIGPYDMWKLWLAEERNFIPVRNVGYMFRSSKEVPLLEAKVTEWKEVEPDIWFPVNYEAVRYDEWKLRDKGVTETLWTDHTVVSSVSLNPAYPAKFFRNVTFPAGVPVYKVDSGK